VVIKLLRGEKFERHMRCIIFSKTKIYSHDERTRIFLVNLSFPWIYSCDKIDALKAFHVDSVSGISFYFEVNEKDPLTNDEGFLIFLDVPD
jgi:hypothetical protein